MDNPAQALLDLLATWKGPANQAPEKYRQAGSVETHAFWQTQNRAVALLIETHRLLDEMHALDPEFELDVFRKHLVTTQQAIYGLRPAWGSASSSNQERRVLPDTTGLRSIASAIRLHRRGSGLGDLPDREALVELLQEALDEVDQAEYLRPEVRAYVWSLIHRAMNLVKDPTSTAGQARSAVFEVTGALVSLEQTTEVPADKKGVLRSLAEKIALGVVVDLAKRGVLEVGGRVVEQISATGC